jgi:TonB family protein
VFVKNFNFFTVIAALLLLVGMPALAAANEKEAIVAPKLIHLPPIAFSEAISTEYAGQTVRVALRISLSDSGAVNGDEVSVIVSSGNDGIDQAVISAVKGAIFSPAYQEGRAIPITIRLPLQVEVQDSPQGAPPAS